MAPNRTILTARRSSFRQNPYTYPPKASNALAIILQPGLWLTGEVVTDWDFVNHLDDPERRDTVVLETRTSYGIPHSVTIGIVGRGADGQERVTAVMHYWRVFQRNVPDYSADSQGVEF